MTKPAKNAVQRPAGGLSASESLLDESIDALRQGLAALRRELDLLIAGKAEQSKHDTASRIAFLLGRVGSIADAVRKVEAARAKRLDSVTRAQVLAYLRKLELADRAQVIREAQEIDQRRSSLA